MENYNGFNDYNDYNAGNAGSGDPSYPQTETPENHYAGPDLSQTPPYMGGAAQPSKPEKPKKTHKKGARVVALALSCAIVGGAVGAGGVVLGQQLFGTGSAASGHTVVQEGKRANSVIDVAKIDTSKQMTAAEVYAANVNSTVGITTSVTTNYWGFQTTAAASGSGFVISEDGYILTNYHVVESSNSITVTAYDGTTYDATLVGYDESNDIAVLKVDATGLTPVTLGDSDNLNVGDSVIAIGNPLGELTFSLTAGAVSALNRQVTLSSNVTMDLIQTDCAINSGNSGGALFNLYGEVIGITNAKYSSSSSTEASIDNIGFAIPINQVKSIVESIIEKGYISKPYIGVSVTDVSEETQSYGLPGGAAVKSVTENGPAAKAGLQVNDIITAVDGTEITGSDDLVAIVGKAAVGDTLKMTVYRNGETVEIEVTVEEQVQSALQNNEASGQSGQDGQSNQQGQDDQQGQDGQQSQGSQGLPWGFNFGN